MGSLYLRKLTPTELIVSQILLLCLIRAKRSLCVFSKDRPWTRLHISNLLFRLSRSSPLKTPLFYFNLRPGVVAHAVWSLVALSVILCLQVVASVLLNDWVRVDEVAAGEHVTIVVVKRQKRCGQTLRGELVAEQATDAHVWV